VTGAPSRPRRPSRTLARLSWRAHLLTRPFRRGFRRELEDPETSLVLDMGGRSQTLLIAFGGLRGRMGVLPFEFFRATGRLHVKRLFVRDLRQAWYHRGMPEHGTTLMDVARALEAVLARQRVERLVVAGNSAGGYAALVFGTLLGADTALCFAPQTTLDLDDLAAIGDDRWDEYLRPLAAGRALDPNWVDLARALPPARRADTRYRVFFDDSLAVDRAHAERLSGLEGARLYRFGGGRHHLVTSLRDSGVLQRLLQDELATRS
jgi:pimeloyl-ACP methyl ester carboxylesterase